MYACRFSVPQMRQVQKPRSKVSSSENMIFFVKIVKSNVAIFPSVVQAYTQSYLFDRRIKLIICQIRHELSVTIHEINSSWIKTLDGRPYTWFFMILSAISALKIVFGLFFYFCFQYTTEITLCVLELKVLFSLVACPVIRKQIHRIYWPPDPLEWQKNCFESPRLLLLFVFFTSWNNYLVLRDILFLRLKLLHSTASHLCVCKIYCNFYYRFFFCCH